MPQGSKPEGVLAIGNAIPTMEALTSLDISRNMIGGSTTHGDDNETFHPSPEGPRAIAAAIRESK
jgi:hypothetical protein